MAELKPCPFCGGTNIAYIRAAGGEWVSLIIDRYGALSLRVCLDCGTVHIPKEECDRIKRRVNNE